MLIFLSGNRPSMSMRQSAIQVLDSYSLRVCYWGRGGEGGGGPEKRHRSRRKPSKCAQDRRSQTLRDFYEHTGKLPNLNKFTGVRSQDPL